MIVFYVLSISMKFIRLFLLPVDEQEIFAHLYTQFALQGALHEEHTEKVYNLIRLPCLWECRS